MTVATPWNPVHASFGMTGTCESLVFDVDLLPEVCGTGERHVDLDGLPDLDGSNVRSPGTDLFYFRVGIAMTTAPRAVLRRRICTAFRAIPARTLLCSPAPGSISLSSLFSMSVYSLSLCSMVDYLPQPFPCS